MCLFLHLCVCVCVCVSTDTKEPVSEHSETEEHGVRSHGG